MGKVIVLAATGGRWGQSCLNALSVGLHFVRMKPLTLIVKSLIGPTIYTSLTILRLMLTRKILFDRETARNDPFMLSAKYYYHSLLCDAPNRLGYASGQFGSNEIREHPFFHRVVWDQLRSIRAPFEPRLSSNVDVSYFPTDEIDQNDYSAAYRAQVDAMDDQGVANMNLPFIGYTYKRFDAFRGS